MTGRQPTPIGSGNQRLKRLRRLVRNRKARSTERAFVVDGPVLSAEALAGPLRVEELFVGADVLGPDSELSAALSARRGETPALWEVDESVLSDVLGPRNPRPVAAVVSLPSWSIDDVGPDGHVLAAVEVRDPGNLGTLIRTAEASGAAGFIVVGDSVDPFSPKAVRASAGSVLRLPVVAVDSVDDLVRAHCRPQQRLLAAAEISPEAGRYDGYDLSRAVLMVGNEPRGLPSDAVAASDVQVVIPLNPPVESLNVAAAGAVLCFEAARQQRLKQEMSTETAERPAQPTSKSTDSTIHATTEPTALWTP